MNWLNFVNTEADIFELDASFDEKALASDASHFIITKNQELIGCLNREFAIHENDSFALESMRDHMEVFYAQDQQNILDIFSLFVKNQTNRLPILGEHDTFLGVLFLNDIFEIFEQTSFILNKADTIIVRKSSVDFTYTKLIQLLESMNAKILGSFICDHNTDYVEVMVKLKHQGLNEILQSLRRFKYNIVSQHDEDQHEAKLKEHSAYLDKYLNI